MGVYVFSAILFPVANILTADTNDARKPPSFHTCGRYRQAPGFPERIIDSQNVFILIASRKDFARQNYKIQASLTRIS